MTPRLRQCHGSWSWSWILLILAFSGWLRAQTLETPRVEIALTGSQVTLQWKVPTNSWTVVEQRDRWDRGSWRPGFGGPWPRTNVTWRPPAATGRSTFYRVALVDPPTFRGNVLLQERSKRYSQFDLLGEFLSKGLPIAPEHPVDFHRIRYETVSPSGRRIEASGGLAIPRGLNRSAPLCSYQHATTLVKEDVPSRRNEETLIGLVLASSGYIVAMPDYLGLGDSPGLHPYHHADSEASASLDFLRATRVVLSRLGISTNGQLFLVGYSQGGHATLALQRELERNATNEFQLTAVAAGAGAYDLSGTMFQDMLSNRVPPNPFYFAYLLAAYQDVYGIQDSFADWLRPPYAQSIPPLFDGRTVGSAVSRLLPVPPRQILKQEILEEIGREENHPLRLAMLENDLYRDWIPRAPLRLYHCRGDDDVLYANSEVALQAFRVHPGVSVELVNPLSLADHVTCVPLVLLDVKSWFDSFRN